MIDLQASRTRHALAGSGSYLALLAFLFVCGASAPSRAQTPTPTPGGDCCAAHGGPGCDDSTCESCVCDIDPVCCLTPWDVVCSAEAANDCAIACPCGVTPTPTPTPGGDCCAAHGGTGCDDQACQTCVCAIDDPCCSRSWDATCVSEASDECLDNCPCEPPPTDTPGPTPTPGGDCCSEHAGVQCDDATCQACVCGIDSTCCDIQWDSTCADEAGVECAVSCACPEAGDCCAEHAGVGCDERSCESCVCDLDPSCCNDGWDATCASEGQNECSIMCSCAVKGPCCTQHDDVGCEETTCQQCVCTLDESCCTDSWDQTCADESQVECAARCTCDTQSDCCAERDTSGCSDSTCESCVCDLDNACCTGIWDATCASEATVECADACFCQASSGCAGDCNGDGEVTINELITGVNIALGNDSVSSCPAVDTNGDGEVAVNELIQAVNSALNGCS